MKIILSPAKTFKPEKFPDFSEYSVPEFEVERNALVDAMQMQSPSDLRETMKVSEKIADLNVGRYQNFPKKLTLDNARQAILSFYGDAYRGLDAGSLDTEGLHFLNDHLRILSGLYGLLRPLDLIAPYRLEMGTRMDFGDTKSLYEFWGDKITNHLKKELNGKPLINLASKEYFSAIDFSQLESPVITPIFKQFKKGKYKTIAILAKRARGQMVRYVVDHRIEDPELLKQFDTDGYRFSVGDSNESDWVFLRDYTVCPVLFVRIGKFCFARALFTASYCLSVLISDFMSFPKFIVISFPFSFVRGILKSSAISCMNC